MSSRGTKYWSSGSIPLIGPDVLGDIIAKAADISVVISESGTVLSVLINPDHPSFGKLDGWEGRDIREFLTIESVPKLEAQLDRFMEERARPSAIELNHADDTNLEFPIRYSFHGIGPDGAILMLGRDLRPVAEMQRQLINAQMALEKDYETQREFDTRFRVLMEECREAFVFIAHASGRIVELNKTAASLLGGSVEELQGSALAQEFDSRRKGELMSSLTTQAMSDGMAPVEVVARRSRKTLGLSATAFRAAGERMLLCRLSPPDDDDHVSDELSENLSALYQEGVEGIVFTDQEGVIQAANESFLNFVDAPHLSRVKGRSLGDFFSRGAVDLKVMTENARRVGQMRLYATKLTSEFGSQVSVEISSAWLNDRANPAVVFVIRDASRAEAIRKTGPSSNDEGMRSVMELVGSASLKEIVSETNDVVEKMCIETAVELTRNNRVAAAEMLGLSRQSLYVKLRKYGLLERSD
ncbi:transcriptional regulator PpsR [Alphaproteobacteria bacterium GH1-50]|uniref:Transcriptional regulator PpsR n=1 Tax=Kangsaoukella pontilimi TaxID=2691042 RepID=A0A7C9N362_9RHOB|nr:transcriptional regulator PpsR [Kangsaoukella pontilimi]MXQ09778.1 transcriptional regulator PpsR [Kangsaoukella pontilimi]